MRRRESETMLASADRPDERAPGALPAPGSVVIGIDGSNEAQVALQWANTHAARLGPLVAVTCWHRPWLDVASLGLGHDVPEAGDAMEMRAKASAIDAVGRLENAGPVPGRPAVITRHGEANDVLVEIAQEARLLVVGSRGRGRAATALLGSTSASCAHHSAAPVAIVPSGVDPMAPIDHIAVGVDGSENSLEALRWALGFAPPGAVIDVYFSWMSLPIASSLTSLELDRVRAASKGFLDTIVDRVISDEQAWHRTIHRHLAVGAPAAVLIEAGASMIVVGARSNGGVISALAGSPANALTQATRTVTVLVPSLTRHE